jgi:hypothetical protein
VELEIRNEMTQQGLPPNTPIHPSVPKQIGYDRGLIIALGNLKIGFYSGQSPVLQRRA